MPSLDLEVRLAIDSGGVRVIAKGPKSDGSELAEFDWETIGSILVTDIDDVGDLFGKSTEFPISIADADVKLSGEAPEEDGVTNQTAKVGDPENVVELGDTGVKYYRTNSKVEFSGDKSNNQHFKDFVNYMFENKYMDRSDLNCKMPGATKNYIIASEPRTISGEEVQYMERISDDPEIYYNPKSPKGQKERHVSHLIKKHYPL
jgi:hypothetical protein